MLKRVHITDPKNPNKPCSEGLINTDHLVAVIEDQNIRGKLHRKCFMIGGVVVPVLEGFDFLMGPDEGPQDTEVQTNGPTIERPA